MVVGGVVPPFAYASNSASWAAGQPVLAYRESIGERVIRIGRRYQVPLVLILMYLLVRAVILVAVRR